MYKSRHLMFLKALTPMHAGGGNQISAVDLPIQREIHTNFPKIEASTIKGCVRNAFHFGENAEHEEEIFGTDNKGNMYASAVSVTDAKILFFPVRSAKGIFGYVTCPFVLERFFNDIKAMDIESLQLLTDTDKNFLAVSMEHPIATTDSLCIKNDVVLEEYTFKNCNINKDFKTFVEILSKTISDDQVDQNFINKSVIISDDEFLHFVEMSTDVITRIKVEVLTGTTDGGLFDEEYLPAESILYSFLFVGDSKGKESKLTADAILNNINQILKNPIQIGGNATLGKGFTSCKLSTKEEK